MNNKLSVLIFAHKFLPQPDDELFAFLNKEKFKNVMQITHDFSDAPTRISRFKWYRNGELIRSEESKDLKGKPEVFIYIREFIFTVVTLLKTKTVWDVSINMDGLCTLHSLFLKKLSIIKIVVYWAMDFVPENRFKSGFKNSIYKKINIFGYANADEMWDLSPRMAEAREKYLGFKEENYKKRVVVPYGMWLDRIQRRNYHECNKNTLVFMGHLIEKQGVQIVLNAIPAIIKDYPDFTFIVIGTGQFENNLKDIVNKLNISNHVKFLGKIEKNEDLESIIAQSCVAIAPYIASLDTWTRYADPGKIKSYLACGVPVLLTDVSWNAQEIETKGCGIIITEDQNNIVSKLLYLFQPDVNQSFRDNITQYARSFDYTTIFNNLEILQ